MQKHDLLNSISLEKNRINIISRKYKIKEPFNYELKKLKKTYNSEVKIKLNGEEKGFIIIPFNNIEDFKEINKKLNGNK